MKNIELIKKLAAELSLDEKTVAKIFKEGFKKGNNVSGAFGSTGPEKELKEINSFIRAAK